MTKPCKAGSVSRPAARSAAASIAGGSARMLGSYAARRTAAAAARLRQAAIRRTVVAQSGLGEVEQSGDPLQPTALRRGPGHADRQPGIGGG